MRSKTQVKTGSTVAQSQLHKPRQGNAIGQLSVQEAQAIWDEGVAFIDRKNRSINWLIELTRTFSEQIRTRPHELELKYLQLELRQIEIPATGTNQPFSQEQQKWLPVFAKLEDLSQRYSELSVNWLPTAVPEFEPPITRRDLMRLLEQMNWKGNPAAYLKQANKDQAIKECQAEGGRGWIASKVIELGQRRGKLEPKIQKVSTTLGSWIFAPT